MRLPGLKCASVSIWPQDKRRAFQMALPGDLPPHTHPPPGLHLQEQDGQFRAFWGVLQPLCPTLDTCRLASAPRSQPCWLLLGPSAPWAGPSPRQPSFLCGLLAGSPVCAPAPFRSSPGLHCAQGYAAVGHQSPSPAGGPLLCLGWRASAGGLEGTAPQPASGRRNVVLGERPEKQGTGLWGLVLPKPRPRGGHSCHCAA